ncbi:hypothetical protein C8F04DRAFT_1229975 [Mycena alexandri]|uniref:Uncharacterized protein n=1 Tax=Mycena alexandri TaxID=1745969 RepID=A0AAD6TC44_9AGAR|nr:hypothetical protein C8F04DRAFT_1229975 [Mycena alexandri]
MLIWVILYVDPGYPIHRSRVILSTVGNKPEASGLFQKRKSSADFARIMTKLLTAQNNQEVGYVSPFKTGSGISRKLFPLGFELQPIGNSSEYSSRSRPCNATSTVRPKGQGYPLFHSRVIVRTKLNDGGREQRSILRLILRNDEVSNGQRDWLSSCPYDGLNDGAHGTYMPQIQS